MFDKKKIRKSLIILLLIAVIIVAIILIRRTLARYETTATSFYKQNAPNPVDTGYF